MDELSSAMSYFNLIKLVIIQLVVVGMRSGGSSAPFDGVRLHDLISIDFDSCSNFFQINFDFGSVLEQIVHVNSACFWAVSELCLPLAVLFFINDKTVTPRLSSEVKMERNVIIIAIFLQIDGESLSKIGWCDLHHDLFTLSEYLIVHVHSLSWELNGWPRWSWSCCWRMWVDSNSVDHILGQILTIKDVLPLVVQNLELAIKFGDIVSIGFGLSSSALNNQTIYQLSSVIKNVCGRQMRVALSRG